MAHGLTLTLREIRPRKKTYVPLRARATSRGRGIFEVGYRLAVQDGAVTSIQHWEPAKPRVLELPGKPMARGRSPDIPPVRYFDDGEGIRRLEGGQSVFSAVQRASRRGVPMDWAKGEAAD